MKVKDMSIKQAKAVLEELRALSKLNTVDDNGFDTGQFVGSTTWLRTRIKELEDRLVQEEPNINAKIEILKEFIAENPEDRPRKGWPTVASKYAGMGGKQNL